jgi:AcrR family transcriptional regulator
VATRRYEQRRRAETAEQTRHRIIDAVAERLTKAPAEPVSLEQIAEMAGVARSTIYAIFGSRAGLFDAVGLDAAERAGYGKLLEAVQHPDAREHLRGGMRASTEMYAGYRDLRRALFSMAQLDEDAVGGSVRRIEEERTAGMARLARRLAEQGELRTGVTVEEAENILWLLTSFESFDLLYTGRRLSSEAVANLLIATAERALLAVPARPYVPPA